MDPRFKLAACALVAGFFLTGCPDTEKAFCDFDEREKESSYQKCLAGCADEMDVAACNAQCDESRNAGRGTCEGVPIVTSCEECATLPMAGEPDGDYLFSLSATLDPTHPILFAATVTVSDVGGELRFSMEITPLDACDRMTPVGNSVTIGTTDSPIVLSGGFCLDATTPRIALPGAANPISGSDVEAEVQLVGSVCSPAGFICGVIPVGNAFLGGNPIDIAGSTFTIERLAAPGMFPDPPKINCDAEEAAGLPMMCP
jgi:hypothetical protein